MITDQVFRSYYTVHPYPSVSYTVMLVENSRLSSVVDVTPLHLPQSPGFSSGKQSGDEAVLGWQAV